MQAWGAGGVGLEFTSNLSFFFPQGALGFTSCVVEELCLQSLFQPQACILCSRLFLFVGG